MGLIQRIKSSNSKFIMLFIFLMFCLSFLQIPIILNCAFISQPLDPQVYPCNCSCNTCKQKRDVIITLEGKVNVYWNSIWDKSFMMNFCLWGNLYRHYKWFVRRVILSLKWKDLTLSKSYTPGLVTAHDLLKMGSRALEHLQFMQKSWLHIFH